MATYLYRCNTCKEQVEFPENHDRLPYSHGFLFQDSGDGCPGTLKRVWAVNFERENNRAVPSGG